MDNARVERRHLLDAICIRRRQYSLHVYVCSLYVNFLAGAANLLAERASKRLVKSSTSLITNAHSYRTNQRGNSMRVHPVLCLIQAFALLGLALWISS